MHDVDVKYMTAMKDYENIVLEQGLAEIENKAAPIDSVKHHLGRQYHSFQDKVGNISLCQDHGVKNQDVFKN